MDNKKEEWKLGRKFLPTKGMDIKKEEWKLGRKFLPDERDRRKGWTIRKRSGNLEENSFLTKGMDNKKEEWKLGKITRLIVTGLSFIVGGGSMSKEEVKSILSSVVLALQLFLGLWQILKLTPVGAMTKGLMGWLLRPLGLSPTYAQLKHLDGRVLKGVKCVGLATEADQPTMSKKSSLEERVKEKISSTYLGNKFKLERRESNMLFLDGKMCYYITDKIWNSLMEMADMAPDTAFVKGYKKIWLGVAAGGVMSLSEVLDKLILDNQVMVRLNLSGEPERLLPVDVTVSEERLLKILNLVGLFVQTKKVYWVVPVLFSLTSALLEFLTPLRVWLYGKVNLLFCRIMHLICDRLPLSKRRVLYHSLGYWVENLKPGNDIELKSVRGDIVAIIAGGAKFQYIEGATLAVRSHSPDRAQNIFQYRIRTTEIECCFVEDQYKCWICFPGVGQFVVDCRRDEFIKLNIFLCSIADRKSGSSKSCGVGKRVFVRGLQESVMCYVKSGYPPVYELNLKNVIVH